MSSSMKIRSAPRAPELTPMRALPSAESAARTRSRTPATACSGNRGEGRSGASVMWPEKAMILCCIFIERTIGHESSRDRNGNSRMIERLDALHHLGLDLGGDAIALTIEPP